MRSSSGSVEDLVEAAVALAMRNKGKHRGKWLLIADGKIVGTFGDYAEARRAAMSGGDGLYVLLWVPEE